MENWQDGSQDRGSRGFFTLVTVVILIAGVIYIAGLPGNRADPNKNKAAKPAAESSTQNSYSYSYRYGSGSGINYGSGTRSYSYSSGTSKKTTKDRKSYYAETHGSSKKSSKTRTYDEFMDDALEDYLSCVDSEDEYWDAVENFGEDWLTPEEKAELDRLMESYSK